MNTKQLAETEEHIPNTDYREGDATEEQLNVIMEPLTAVETNASGQFDTWNVDSIIDHIISAHHRYAKQNAVIIYDLSQKVAHRHNKNHPEFATLAAEIFFFLHDLLNNMMKEEKILFPNIRQLMKSRNILGSPAHTTFGAMGDSVRLIQEHHKAVGNELKVLRQLTNNYKLPEDACNLCSHLFTKMQEFETDLLIHVDLESNILFPKAIAVE